MTKKSWYERRVPALCLLIGIAVFAVVVLARPEAGGAGGSAEGYTVILRHYGMDAREMERSAAIPLEDALAALPGVRRIVSSSEKDQARVFVSFRPRGGAFWKRRGAGAYDALRDAVERVYETLPSSAQRPEIHPSDNSLAPVWTAAVWKKDAPGAPAEPRGLGQLLTKEVKPALESIEGAGEVIIAGPGVNEIIVTLDQKAAGALGIGPAEAAQALAWNDLVYPGGAFPEGERDLYVSIDGRYDTLDGLASQCVASASGGLVRLRDFAAITEQERQGDSLGRLDGRPAAVLSMLAASGADPGALSRRLNAEIKKLQSLPLEFLVLEDRGAEETKAYRSVFSAALGAALLACLGTLFVARAAGPRVLLCGLLVPFAALVSAALLALFGLRPSRALLAGLAVGIGSAIDPIVLSAECIAQPLAAFRARLRRVRPPLIAGTVTTIIALLPLAGYAPAADITPIVWALGSVSLAALLAALFLLPPLIANGGMRGGAPPLAANGAGSPPPVGALRATPPQRPRPPAPFYAPPPSGGNFLARLEKEHGGCATRNLQADHAHAYSSAPATPPLDRGVSPNPSLPSPKGRRAYLVTRLKRRGLRLLARMAAVSVKRPLVPLLVCAALTAGGIAALVKSGADTGGAASQDSVYTHIEFEGALLKEEADRLLGNWALKLKDAPGVRHVQTSARTGSGSALVSFDPRVLNADKTAALIRESDIPGGFIHIPEGAGSERLWTLSIAGDENAVCRDLARKAASLCAGLAPLVRETVLNFKEGAQSLEYLPRREKLAAAGLSAGEAAGELRRGVYGPVAYKRIDSQGETDVRIRGLAPLGAGGYALPSRDEARDCAVSPVVSGSAVMEERLGPGLSSIYRENRRRSASITIRTPALDPRVVKARVLPALAALELPPSYSVTFDEDAVERAEALSRTRNHFLLAILFCFMFIAAVNESLKLPLLVLAVVPVSIAAPVLVMAALGISFNAAAACAFVAVSGMAVNAAALVGDCFKPFLQRGSVLAVRRAYIILRGKLSSLIATAGTTIAGAAPFLFLPEAANASVRVLSLVTAAGVAASCLVSLILIPAGIAGWSQLMGKLFPTPYFPLPNHLKSSSYEGLIL
ncbi:MAG: efflux RND transporter permease subunit [Treponema sp.]|jgi:multidrug efflux pump subunit AcrB|nr:efflux RND transporter permease subunit [Treponema sp.]